MYEKFVSITLISWIGEVKFCKRWTDHTRSGFVARLSVLISIVSYELRCADSLAGCGVGGWGINTFLFFFFGNVCTAAARCAQDSRAHHGVLVRAVVALRVL